MNTTAMELYEIPKLKHNPYELIEMAQPRSYRHVDASALDAEEDFKSFCYRLINLEEKRQGSDNQAGAFEYERDLEAMRRKQLDHLDIHFGVRVDDLKALLKKAKKLQPKKKDRKGVGMWGDEMYDILFVAVTLEIRNGQLAAYVYVPQPETNEIVRQYVPERIQVSGAGYSVNIPVALDALVGTPSAPGNLDFEDKGTALMMRHEYATGDLRYQSGKSRVRVARAVVRNRHWSRSTMTAELSWQCYDHDGVK